MAYGIHFGNNKPTDNRHYLLKISGAAYSVVNLNKMIIENNNTNLILLTYSILLYT